jgi:hypothetical protein
MARTPAPDAFLSCTLDNAVAWRAQRSCKTATGQIFEVHVIPLDAPTMLWWMLFPHLFQEGWSQQRATPLDIAGNVAGPSIEIPRPEGWESCEPPKFS